MLNNIHVQYYDILFFYIYMFVKRTICMLYNIIVNGRVICLALS